MKTVLVAYASRMGSTQEIAAVIGDQLTGRGFDVQVGAAAAAPNARIVDAVVLGSALYTGRRWDRDAVDYLRRNAPDLADRPTWLFQSGPSGPPTGVRDTPTPRAVRRWADKIGLAAPTTFGGNLDHSRAKGLLARWVSVGDLAGDFRDWDQIRAWADDIADQLMALREPAGT
jgi:menaquinone-dependent protoporphyrinogen oxidase